MSKVQDLVHNGIGWIVIGTCLVICACGGREWLTRKSREWTIEYDKKHNANGGDV